MYRFLLTILLCLHAASPAPQGIDSDVTYVKIQPVVEDSLHPATQRRESRIEMLPLTIPGNLSHKDPDKNITRNSEQPNVAVQDLESHSDLTESESELTEIRDDQHLAVKPTSTQSDLTDDDNQEIATTDSNSGTSELNPVLAGPEESAPSELIPVLSGSEESAPSELNPVLAGPDESAPSELSPDLAGFVQSAPSILSPDLTEPESSVQPAPNQDLSESNSENVSDTIALETQSERQARNFDSAETTEIADTTERLEIDHIIEITTKSPKFVPKAKSSYFQKPRVFQSYASNFVDNPRKRFRSRCRCEKIWNCPKLQISVPRCPNEYFLCCF